MSLFALIEFLLPPAANMTTQLSDVCKSRLFRVTLTAPVEGIAFVMADSREAAWRMGKTVIAVVQGVGVQNVAIAGVHSFGELVSMGTCDDLDMRVFEVASPNGKNTDFAEAPYFLTNDASLLGKWAELRADLAANVARALIRRAK